MSEIKATVEEVKTLKKMTSDLLVIWNRFHKINVDNGVVAYQLRYVYNLERLRQAMQLIEKFIETDKT